MLSRVSSRVMSRRGSLIARAGRWIVGISIVGACAPAAASAATFTVNDDASGSGPSGATCAAPNFSAIEAAISGAAAGDTLLVCDGTYTEPDNQILVEKGITVIGNGRATTILDGQNATGLPTAGFIRTNDNTAGNVTFRGFTIRNAGQNGTGSSTARFAVNLLGNDPGFTFTFDDIRFEGRGAGGRDYAFYGQNADQNVTLTNSTLVNQAYNPILIERVNGQVDVSDNIIDKLAGNTSASIFAFTHSNDNIFKKWSITGNEIDNNGIGGGIVAQTGLAGGGASPATLGPVVISDNTIREYTSSGIGVINTSAAVNGLNGQISDVTISGNHMIADPSATTANGIVLQGLSSAVDVTGNWVEGAGIARSAYVVNGPGGHAPSGVDFAFNRFAAGSTAGLLNNTTSAVSAENNWWGCNQGPADNSNGCAPVVDSTPASTDFDPWMVLGVSAAPASIETGGQTATVSLSLAKNSTGATPSGNVLLGPIDVAMNTDLGAIAPATVTLDSGYQGSATLTSGPTAGTATVTAALDAADPTAQVEFTEPPEPPEPPVVVNDCANPAQGTSGPDVFIGTPAEDGYVGRGGDDELRGSASGDCLNGQGGDDQVRGEAGDDFVNGGGGEDDVRGGAADDTLRGFGGDDVIQGGGGNDDARGGSGEDLVRGGGGDDTLHTRDTFADEVRCGGGDDVAIVDRRDDVASNCEVVKVG